MLSRLQNLIVALAFALVFAVACRPASYEFVKDPEKKVRAHPEENPREFGPDGRPDAPTETPPPAIDGNLPPSANVEVILDGRSVTKIRVNTKVLIRPTLDTADADDIGKSICVNPGIVTASYRYLDESPEVTRSLGCESLGVEHTFTTVGDIVIDLTVTSNENETARASMILTVISSTAPEADTDGGFTISADPIIAGRGQKIVFTGVCDATTKTTITWDFKDAATATGRQVTHRFEETGQYEVEAECTDENGKKRRAKLTVVVLESPIYPDGIENPDLNRDPEPDNPGNGDGNPDGNDNPGNPKQQQGGLTPPTQSPCHATWQQQYRCRG